MKMWKLILAAILAICVVALVPLSVMAQNSAAVAAAPKDGLKGGLALVAPRAVKVDQEMQLAVFLRWNQEPVADVGIWAVSKDKVEAVKQAIQDLRKDSSIQPADKDYAQVLDVQARRLGTTGNKGQLKLNFKEEAQMFLVAFKRNYLPDWSPLVVKNAPRALAIAAPRLVKLGDAATITVHLKGSPDKVAGAGVWAVSVEKAADLKAAVASARAANQAAPATADYAAVLNAKAMRLGVTGGDGQLTYTFKAAGKYALVTFKAGYIPGFGALAVVAPKVENNPSPSTAK